MEAKSPMSKAPLALQTLVTSQLSTIEGMSNHLALLATGSPEIRAVAVQWFGAVPKRVQIDMIRAAGRNAENACQLAMLVPDAVELMPHLGLSIVRRMCNKHPALLTAVTSKRLATMVRVTRHPSAKREWLTLIAEWNQDEAGWLEQFLDELDPVEVADWLVGMFRIKDIPLLQETTNDPTELEEHLDELFPFVRMMSALRPEFYRAMIGEIILRLNDRYERRSRLNTQDELQRSLWRNLTEAVEEVTDPDKDESAPPPGDEDDE